MKEKMKKHSVITVVLFLLIVIIAYLMFNLFSPQYVRYHKENLIKIKGIDYEERWDWQIIDKNRLTGRVTQDNYEIMSRLILLFFPERLYTVKGDENNISYYLAPTKISEFPWGYNLYRMDEELPTIENVRPSRIELAKYFDLSNEVYYYTEDKDLIDEIINIVRNPEEIKIEYSMEDILKLEKINEKGYGVCFFTNEVPGSVYIFYPKKDGYEVDIDISSKEEDYINITYAIYKMITEGNEIAANKE